MTKMKKIKWRKSVVLTITIPLLIGAAAVLFAGPVLNAVYRVPQNSISPEFLEPTSSRELIPYDEGEFNMADGDILVEPSGEAPSIARAQEILRERGGMEPVTVWIKGGTYEQPLEFTAADRSHVTWRKVPGEEVVFTGSKAVAGWRPDTVNGVACWSAEIDCSKDGWYFTSLYHPAKQISRPRYPAEGYLFVDSVEGAQALFTKENAPWGYTRGHTSFFAKEGDLRQFRAMEDVTLRVLHKWKDEISNLVSFDETSRELVWQRFASMSVEKNDRYFLENVFEELKNPGQWYLDRESAMLYYIPFQEDDPETTVLYAGVNERLLTVDGAENITFKGISFQNTAWTMPDGTAWGVDGMEFPQAAVDVNPAVLVTNSKGVNFDGCTFNNIGSTALKLGVNTQDSSVVNCEFTQIGANAVFIEGEWVAKEDPRMNRNITVKNNLIAHYGRRFFNAIGVLNIHAAYVEISHNEIFDGYYTGISSGWHWGYNEHPTDYVSIENNLIHTIGQGWLSDMGGIYTLGPQPNSVIRGNLIYHVAADPLQGGYGGWGIYLDEGTSQMTVEKNLVYDCGSQSFHQHYGKENVVRNNILAFSGEGQIRVSRMEEHTSVTFERNIIVSGRQIIYAEDRKGKFADDGNLYFDYADPGRIFSGSANQKKTQRLGILKMRRMGYYQNALIADPLFKDAESFDFTLAVNSPAITELGFEMWDYGEAGRLTR